MTVKAAYRALDLAPGLGRERVQIQFQFLVIDLNNRLNEAKSPNLKALYASRLKEIEAAKAILDQNFDFTEVKASDDSEYQGTDDQTTDIQFLGPTLPPENTPYEIEHDKSISGEEPMLTGFIEDAHNESESNSSSTVAIPQGLNRTAPQIGNSAKKMFLKAAWLVGGGILLLLFILFIWNLIDPKKDPFRHLPNEKYVLVNKLNFRATPETNDYSVIRVLLYGTRIVELDSNVKSEKGLKWSRVAVFSDSFGWERPDTGYIVVSECDQTWLVDSSSFYRFHSLFEHDSLIANMSVKRRYVLVNFLNESALRGVDGFKFISVEEPIKYCAVMDVPDPRKKKNCAEMQQDGFAVILNKGNTKEALFFKTDKAPFLVRSIKLDSKEYRFDRKIYNYKPLCNHGGLKLERHDGSWKDYAYYYFAKTESGGVDLINKPLPNEPRRRKN